MHKLKDCPLSAVDQRLNDVHDLWHQAEAAYFDPNKFRIAIQTTIQMLRTVTFVLQKNKATIPHFDDWYARWQEGLGKDPLMRWMVDARNRIEKQGDLESRSFIRAEVIASYLEEGRYLEVNADLFVGPDELLKSIPEGKVAEHIRANGALRMQRKWIVNDLPDYELLEAVAIAFGRIAEVVQDAHRQINTSIPTLEHDGVESRSKKGGPPTCMIGHADTRTLLISLANGEQVKVSDEIITPKKEEMEKAADHYGLDPSAIFKKSYESNQELASAFFEVARTMFLKDGHHGAFVFLLKDKQLAGLYPYRAETRGERYIIMRDIATRAEKVGADAVFNIDEAWIASANKLAPFQYPSDSEHREEILGLTLLEKGSKPLSLFAKIHREGGTLKLGETTKSAGGASFMFAPILKVWGEDVPEEWLKAAKEADKDSK